MVQPCENAVRVASGRADLSDFDNFFDTGDTLDGAGRCAWERRSARALETSGNIHLSKFRYRNLPIGDTRANLVERAQRRDRALRRRRFRGELDVSGTVGVVPSSDIATLLKRSRYDLKRHGEETWTFRSGCRRSAFRTCR